ncbi:TetR/AcrR family transcriptional regulator [Bradyrhizobium sp. Cp5.3]|uniref:TetR/AcrR family transcriptional regulator n=1 Tax=Bradyrhizobium sp. Cp5.3 TaxID=443598 RepID=UPI0003F6D5A4|nr:TetR/AcrR family transcriptional regulator [Bradyrhizobium sp. Cp5.3]
MIREKKSKSGRPRSEEARLAILRATNQLLNQVSVRDLTIEGIAKAAGVGKPTIYRWWPNKAAVVIDAFSQTVSSQLQFSEDGSVVSALRKQLRQIHKEDRGRVGRIMAEILAEGQFDADVLRMFRERYLDLRRAQAKALIELGKQRGEISSDLDADLAIDMIYGSTYYRLLVRHLPLEDALADQVMEWVFAGFAPRSNSVKAEVGTARTQNSRRPRVSRAGRKASLT